jgi:hypothetical protein
MSEKDVLIREKSELIAKMLEMQEKFVDLEHNEGLDPGKYYDPAPGSALEGYVEQYNELAQRVNKLAHQIKESGHIH